MKDFLAALGLDKTREERAAPDTDHQPRFACRPLLSRTSEHGTAFGLFTGRIGLTERLEFKAALDELVLEKTDKIVVDFSTAVLSRSAMGVLVAFASAVHGRNKKLYLFSPSDMVLKQLKDLDLTPFFTILQTENDIIAALVA